MTEKIIIPYLSGATLFLHLDVLLLIFVASRVARFCVDRSKSGATDLSLPFPPDDRWHPYFQTPNTTTGILPFCPHDLFLSCWNSGRVLQRLTENKR